MAVVRLRHEARSVCRCRLLQPAPRRQELHELRELLVLCEAPRTRGGARRLCGTHMGDRTFREWSTIACDLTVRQQKWHKARPIAPATK